MNCNCKKEIELKLLENYTKANPTAKEPDVSIQGYGFVIIGSGLQERGFLPVDSKAKFPTKAGVLKPKTTKQSMFWSFCPFCGVSATAKPEGVPA
jgi:hypothetical protein